MADYNLRASEQSPGPERAVTATINYIADTEIRPFLCNDDFSRSVIPLSPVAVQIEDASQRVNPPRLDAEGFALIRHDPESRRLAEGDDATLLKYGNELRELLSSVIKADEIYIQNAHIIRRSKRSDSANSVLSAAPATFVHSDTTKEGAWDTVALLGAHGPHPSIKRLALFNLWRLISPPPTNLPLAVLDARSLDYADIVPGTSRFEALKTTVEVAFVKHNSSHRWSYFSGLNYQNALLFKQFDSEANSPVLVPHTAFVHQLVSPAEPRVSIESRVVAYWFN
jgi:hypothetical protein